MSSKAARGYHPLIYLVYENIKINWPIDKSDWYLFTNHWEGFMDGLK